MARGAGSRTRELKRPVESINDAEEVRRIRAMPKEVGILLIVAGIGGILLPGPVGTPFLVLGGVVLWPRAFQCLEGFLERRFPRFHHQSMLQITRFINDLERRYPLEK